MIQYFKLSSLASFQIKVAQTWNKKPTPSIWETVSPTIELTFLELGSLPNQREVNWIEKRRNEWRERWREYRLAWEQPDERFALNCPRDAFVLSLHLMQVPRLPPENERSRGKTARIRRKLCNRAPIIEKLNDDERVHRVDWRQRSESRFYHPSLDSPATPFLFLRSPTACERTVPRRLTIVTMKEIGFANARETFEKRNR